VTWLPCCFLFGVEECFGWLFAESSCCACRKPRCSHLATWLGCTILRGCSFDLVGWLDKLARVILRSSFALSSPKSLSPSNSARRCGVKAAVIAAHCAGV
jgi:hypothetical protein